MKKLLVLFLSAVGCTASTVYTCGLISGFGTQPSGTLIFYPLGGNFGTNMETTLSQSVPFTNGCFTNLTLTGGNYEVDYYNRLLLNIFVSFNDTNNWQLTDLATNLTSYVTFGQLGVFSNNVYAASYLAGQQGALTVVATASNALAFSITNLYFSATNIQVISNTPFAAATFYTNTSGRENYVSATVILSTATGNSPSTTMFVGNGPGAWLYTNVVNIIGSGGLGGQVAYVGTLAGMVGPGQVFAFTNSAGGGSSTMSATNNFWLSF